MPKIYNVYGEAWHYWDNEKKLWAITSYSNKEDAEFHCKEAKKFDGPNYFDPFYPEDSSYVDICYLISETEYCENLHEYSNWLTENGLAKIL